ncbi:MAG: class I mannose-6-phosphate isomerase [Sphingomonadaceae bacterium]|nr:class I mannose-6-phosphate isomerase [Sphingomonadaceae bacterium]
MSAVRLTTKRVEKPWGRHDLWPGFPDQPKDKDPVGEVWFEEPDGSQPPLLVKYLFTSEKLSVQVHPDDQYARAHGYHRGKDEAWLILSAEPHATIALGTLYPMDKDELRRSALDGSIEKKLDWKAVKADDSYYSPAGTVHAIGPGLVVIEVQQNVDLTYRLYDYGSARELHVDDAVAVADPVPYVAPYIAHDVEPGRTVLGDGPAFVLERWRRSGSGTLDSKGRGSVWLVPVKGGGTLDGGRLEPGGVWVATAPTALTLDDGADLLVAYSDAGVIDGIWG